MEDAVERGECRSSARQVPRGGAVDVTWGIKESFRAYFERLPDHVYGLDGGVERCAGGEFRFPSCEEGRAAGGPEVLSFSGTVRLTAHFGALSVVIADPRVLMDGDGRRGVLSAVVDEVDGQPVRMVIADLTLAGEGPAADSERRVCFSASLATEGQYLFMGNYYAGDPLDAVTVRFAEPAAP